MSLFTKTNKKKYFFGWSNFKWLFIEILKIYSDEPSFFSKKRIESGVSFIIAQCGMIFFLSQKYSTLSMGEFMLWAAAEFAVSGYIINKIQQEKKIEMNTATTDTTTQTVTGTNSTPITTTKTDITTQTNSTPNTNSADSADMCGDPSITSNTN